MSKLVLSLVLLAASISFSQLETDEPEKEANVYKNSVTIGLLQGGGSLVGIDYERMVSKNVGLQIGAGYLGFGAGINFHLKPTVQSSAISIAFWNQGLTGSNLGQRVIGSTYLFRSKVGFTAQLGLGYVLELGQRMKDYYADKNVKAPNVILLYSLGWYFKT